MNKKYIGVFGLGCMTLLLTGCGGNKLNCSCVDKDEERGERYAEYVFHYDEEWKTIESIDYEYGYRLSDSEAKNIDDYEEELKESCDDDDAPSDCKVTVSGNDAYLTATADADTFGIDKDTSKDDMIEEIESDDECSCK